MPKTTKTDGLTGIKKAIIGASIYKVIHTDENIVAGGEHCYGSHGYSAREIKITIDEDVHLQQREETLLHEIIHAIDGDRDLELSEGQIGGVSAGVYQAMRDNKNIFDLFTFGL